MRAWVLGLVLVACQDRTRPAVRLAEGREAYRLYCVACHGEAGDGHGPAASRMRPLPRDFRQGLFKFSDAAAGELPSDDALLRTLRRGLHGTPMLAWDIPEPQRRDILEYVKTFSRRWKDESPGKRLEVAPDPWTGRSAEAVSRGRVLYHLTTAGNAGCAACHPSYLSEAERRLLDPQAQGAPRYRASLHESEYPLTTDPQGEAVLQAQVLPTDFLFTPTKTVWPLGTQVDGAPYTAERQREDVYRVIASGVGGAAMPQWKGALPEESLWALAYYVQSLIQEQGTPQALEARRRLEHQPPGKLTGAGNQRENARDSTDEHL